MPLPDEILSAAVNGILGGHHTDELPDTVECVVFAVLPADDGTGGVEITGSGYARVLVDNDATNWPDAIAGLISNGLPLPFGPPSGPWDTAVGYGWRNPDTGTYLGWDYLDEPFTADDGDTVVFDVGTFTLRATNR